MRKILFVISYLDCGGAERALASITTHLPKEYEIDILLNGRRPVEFPYRGNLLYLDIDEEPKMASLLFHLKILYRRWKKLYKLKKSNEYMACISFLDSANIANILTGNKNCKTIISVRNSLKEQSILPQYKYVVIPLVRMFYQRADKVTAVSQGIYTELIDDFRLKKNKVIVIENGYDLEQLKKAKGESFSQDETDFVKGKRVIATVGRLIPQKGQWHLIRAFSEVIKKVPDAVLMLIGSGELEDDLKKLAADNRLGLAGHIMFTGYSDNPHKYVAKADVFVMPSLYEGFPNALAEAVCLGIPCIATDFKTGAREILAPDLVDSADQVTAFSKEQYGMLTPVCSGTQYQSGQDKLEAAELELAKAIVFMLQNEKERLHYAEMSRQRREALGIESVVHRYEEIICND